MELNELEYIDGFVFANVYESELIVKIDPETYKILDGKLFLFYNFWGNNTLTDWNKNEKPLKARGDQNWKKFIP